MLEKAKLMAVVRVRGYFGMNPKRKTTLIMLNLPRANNCTVLHPSPSYLGMLHEVKDFATWGEIGQKTLAKLVEKRGRKNGNIACKGAKEAETLAAEIMGGKTLAESGLDKTFRLTPPTGGWKGKKMTFPEGDLGKRGSIDELLARMI